LDSFSEEKHEAHFLPKAQLHCESDALAPQHSAPELLQQDIVSFFCHGENKNVLSFSYFPGNSLIYSNELLKKQYYKSTQRQTTAVGAFRPDR